MKDSEMLIVEDLLLLLLDDRTGAIAGEGTLYYVLGGAVLAELDLLGAVERVGRPNALHGQRVKAVGEPPADPLLSTAFGQVARKAQGAQALLIEIGSRLRQTVLDRLLERDLLRRETTKVLGLFPSTRLPANDPAYEAALMERVRGALEDGVEADARTMVLAALLSASGTLPELNRHLRWSLALHSRGKELEERFWVARTVDRSVRGIGAASAMGDAIAAARKPKE